MSRLIVLLLHECCSTSSGRESGVRLRTIAAQCDSRAVADNSSQQTSGSTFNAALRAVEMKPNDVRERPKKSWEKNGAWMNRSTASSSLESKDWSRVESVLYCVDELLSDSAVETSESTSETVPPFKSELRSASDPESVPPSVSETSSYSESDESSSSNWASDSNRGVERGGYHRWSTGKTVDLRKSRKQALVRRQIIERLAAVIAGRLNGGPLIHKGIICFFRHRAL
ncbi:hypothetical protein C8J56DRAFT_895338 [Mycena floridula]|nr:hypothetical protein C8J56DRAFT_895338 [Mycena floridula]